MHFLSVLTGASLLVTIALIFIFILNNVALRKMKGRDLTLNPSPQKRPLRSLYLTQMFAEVVQIDELKMRHNIRTGIKVAATLSGLVFLGSVVAIVVYSS